MTPQAPFSENQRLHELYAYNILDTLSEEEYNNITSIAAEVCDTPVALISLIDSERQWFKSCYGLGISETPKVYSFCTYALYPPYEPLIIPDARHDERFKTNPLVTDYPGIVFYTGVPLLSDNGVPLGTLCVVDFEARKLTNRQLESLKGLAHQVMKLLELRKSKLAQEKANKELENKNEELEKFAYVAAHDLKSPLRNISNLAGILFDYYHTEMSKEAKEFLEDIQNSSEKLKNLVDGLLEYSKSETVLQENRVWIDLNNFTHDLKTILGWDYCCDIQLHTDVQQININQSAFYQIMINLVNNAVKYNDKTEATIEIGASDYPEQYLFYVQDNGPGIPDKYKEKIFNLFEVLDTKDINGQRGTGIGLGTVKKLVEAQDGYIRVESSPGNGTRFEFTIAK